ncbi:hypothetical protein RYX36_030019 [Vicia faba]
MTPSQEKRHHSIFELPQNYFDSCRLLPSPHSSVSDLYANHETLQLPSNDAVVLGTRLTCNTCKAQFDSLQDQRSHFKSDIHRFNVKLTIAGKHIVKEDDFEVLTSDFVKDYDVSSISGSESDTDDDDDSENEGRARSVVRGKYGESFKQKLFVCLQTGQRVSVWKCLIMNVSENVVYEDEQVQKNLGERLKSLTVEPRDNSRLRIVLLASGGHFAGCVFDGETVVAHKTFHRYVVRAKAGKKQSTNDASGRTAHSAGASLRRYNELALKKEVHELLTAWRPYFDASICIFIHAPSSSRQLLYDGEKPCFTNPQCARNISMIVRRPTLREAKRVYGQLTLVSYEADEKEILQCNQQDAVPPIRIAKGNGAPPASKVDMAGLDKNNKAKAGSSNQNDEPLISSNDESENDLSSKSTPLHQAAQSADSQKVMELLEQGLDPCIKDERGQTPYMLALDKEVRNTFRRFMASNPDKWDWNAAKVPSALTKEMEESQAAKQAEKDAKKKARAKELKKLRKAKEKKAQAEAVEKQKIQTSATGQSQPKSGVKLSKEEEMKRAQDEEREKRAAAAERRMAALKIQADNSISEANKSGLSGDIVCSCCNSSLAGKVPFHRYNYKYCSTSCMHVHREILEDG